MTRKKKELTPAEKASARKDPSSSEAEKKRASSGEKAAEEAREAVEGTRTRIGYTMVGIALIAIVTAFGYISMGGAS